MAHGRILHVLKYYRPDFSGEAVFLERSSSVMAYLAPGVTHDLLVTTTRRPAHAPATCSALDRIHYLARRQQSIWVEEIRLVAWMALNIRRYDTVHFRTHADWYFLSYAVARLAGRRLVLSATLDDSVPALIDRYRPGLRPIARRLFGLFNAFITLNTRLQAENASVIDPHRCHLLPIGVLLPPDCVDMRARRAAFRAALDIPQDALVLVSVGGLCARKDPAFLVQHLAAIRRERPNTFLLLVGPDLEAGYVERLRADAAASNGHVRLVGEVEDASDWYDASDIMVFASRLEGFGTVVTEAMAHRLPVVARRLPEVNDSFVVHGRTGYAFDDADGFITAVLELGSNPEQRRRMAEAGRQLVAQHFDLTSIAERYLGVYGFASDADAIEPPTETVMQGAPAGHAWRSLLQVGMSTSLVNARFHRPAGIDCGNAPVLITVIDAEEAFEWSDGFSRDRVDVTSMRGQGAAHRIFEAFGVVPVYAVDWPVVSQDAGRAPLIDYLADGRCDIGAQLHGWVTPPFEESVSVRTSFACNLPPRLQYEKLRRLTDCIADTFGMQPRVHRSGRYGIGSHSGNMLRHLGYQVDSSVVPHWSYAAQGGPDFRAFAPAPYWTDAARTLLEIPLTAALCGRLSGGSTPRHRIADAVFSAAGAASGAASIAARAGLLERIKLTPEGMTLDEMKRLTRVLMARGRRVFMLTYHTPSLQPGNTPYVRTEADAAQFLARLQDYYGFFTSELGGRAVRWQQVYEAARQGVGDDTAAVARRA